MQADDAPLTLGAPQTGARALCVFLHGRGQTPEEMQEQVIRHLTVPGVAYVLPRAPGKVWYDAKAVDPLTETTQAQLVAGLDRIAATIGTPQVPLLLAGFSQGACMALEYALLRGAWHGGLVAFTGCRVGDAARPVADLGSMPVYLTGSDADPWIPLPAFAAAVEACGRARAQLRAECFPGRSHEVSRAEINVLDQMLATLARQEA
ncbi:dienelactone hydrolase family protein [Fertoebacter nigrum]|uniref:Dienelactone hydrolase family protein n=1 Tax=Fertoeibacter niger TaxID=2656921 RepID=A0A8X8GYG5_9RHOB|nr:dienelactone hydrolase family protein [Fertoeibacter niger]NUB42779.1 dienelactone hydrolase family protein [Fertoeibacter niger]